FSILLIDVDDFKSVNDKHGHQVGDGILRGLGSFLRQNLRDSDFPARYGGEEFICLLPSTDQTHAIQAGEKIRHLLAQSKLSSKKMDVSLQITVSIGIATLNDNESIDDLIKRADSALYKSKRNGKNQVVSA
ncbi:GGDEF domain-containing protein, partial [bacterium]|nr:GGDEF domain-containing protein [bacterium]